VKTVYDRMAMFAYRANNVFRAAADVNRTLDQLPMPGNVITFNIINALTAATSTISETAEPSPVTMAVTQPTVTLAEYGNVVQTTQKARALSFLYLDRNIPREVAAHMEESVDLICRGVAIAGTNVERPNGHAKNAIVATDTLTAAMVRKKRAQLRGNNTPTPNNFGEYFEAIIHPDVAYDLKSETGQAAWSAPHVYSDPANIYSGEIGAFEQFRFLENANAAMDVDAGSGSTVDVYHTLFIGANFLGEGVGIAQGIRITGPYDNLGRFVSVGWYFLGGFGRIRENSGRRVETASSIGAN
jgi:N4-gp56 family major capsid protein